MPNLIPDSYLPLKQKQLTDDAVAGLTFAVVNVPQGMANALLATVNPVFGLYTLMIATPIGALFTSSVFMNVSTTGALSVAVGDALVYYPSDQKTEALITLVVLIGVFQLISGLLKFGNLIRFVSQAVMTGFITGIALNIVIGALPDLTGYTSPENIDIPKLADMILHIRQFDPWTVVLGLATIGLIIGFDQTKWRKVSLILALAVITIVAYLLNLIFGVNSLELVGDIAYIPRSLPTPALPDLSLVFSLIMPAVAIGIIGLIQGAGVGQSYPNPDGKYPDISKDFLGQGVANIATGLFQGIPGGGSMSGTAVTVNAGAKSRWANIFAGIFVAVIVLAFVDLVKLVPMAALGGLLVVVGFQNIRPKQIEIVWHTSLVSRTAMLLTLLATLIMPLQFAILVGVIIAILLHVFQASNQVQIVEFVPVQSGFPIEQPAPTELTSRKITILHPYGSLFFAAAPTFEQKLPVAERAQQAVVILSLRGQSELGSTFISVLHRYAQELQTNGGKLMLTGVSQALQSQLERTGTVSLIGADNLFLHQEQLGEPLNAALIAARAWLAQVDNDGASDQ